MKFIHRLGFYLGGFVIGLILLFFFLGGKKTSCDYGPEARTLKNIRLKELRYSENSLIALNNYGLDSLSIPSLLKNGSVLFSESNTDLDSCKIYSIEGVVSEKKLKILIENCKETARVNQITLIE